MPYEKGHVTMTKVKKVALLTAGGFAPCLSTAIAGLIEEYTQVAPEAEIIAYRHGYEGLLKGDYLTITEEVRRNADILTRFGGSPIGSSRVKLTNTADLVNRGLVDEGDDPLKVASERLIADGVDVLHTIGGDDTNTTAADLAAYLADNDHGLTVVGLPKTIDNDVVPIKQSLGAWTAAEQGSRFAQNIVGEHNSGSRMLIIHEIMGRNCGWLAAATAAEYHAWVGEQQWLPEIGLSKEAWDVHAVYVPESPLDLDAEAERLGTIMDEVGNVTIFLSEGAGLEAVVGEMERHGEEVMVQKSGYFSRSAASNQADIDLIFQCTKLAVECALSGRSGVIGQDEENGDELTCIAFDRIKGGKPFDTSTEWFTTLLNEIGQA